MLAVSSRFTESEQSDVNQVASKVYLILGNYAAAENGGTVVASGSDASGNYPAAGAIDGDRTELNVGAATAADDDVGLSSWRSAVAPSVTPQTLTVNMGQSRTINRIKLYQLSSHGLSSYKLESSPDNSVWTLIAKTTDQGGDITTTHELDTIDFDDVTCQYVKLTIADTVVAADKANVVEIEFYRLIDISERVVTAKVDRHRDYKLGNPLATTLQVLCQNGDRFFSFDYSPTAAEIADGYINSELEPNIGILAEYGFAYGGAAPELVSQFVGYVDRIRINPRERTAVLEARDGMKPLINQTLASKLKTSIDIGAAILYALNLCNVSTWETDLDTTGIVIDYFYIDSQQVLSTIRDLVQAAGDAVFYYDEEGIATFRTYLGQTPQSETISSEAEWEAGTVLTNIDTVSTPDRISRKWFLIDDFSDGNFNSNPVWNNRVEPSTVNDDSQANFEAGTVKTNLDTTSDPGTIKRKWFLCDAFADGDYTSNPAWQVWNGSYGTFPPFPPNRWAISGGQLRYNANSSGEQGRAWFPFNGGAYGTWEFKVTMETGGVNSGLVQFWMVANGAFVTFGPKGQLGNGYLVSINKSTQRLQLQRDDPSGLTDLGASFARTIDGAQHTVRVTRTPAGEFNVYWDGVSIYPGTLPSDTTYTTNVLYGVQAQFSGIGGTIYADFDDFRFSRAVLAPADAYTGSQTVFESRVFDLTADVATLGQFNAVYTAPSDGSISWFVATSADGVTFDPYVAISPGGLMTNTVRRYVKYKAILICAIDSGNSNGNCNTPTISSVTLAYTTVGWKVITNAAKYVPLASGITAGLDIGLLSTVGTWKCNVTLAPGSGAGMAFRMYILTTGYDIPTTTYLSGYYAQVDQANGKLGIYEINATGSRSLLAEFAIAINTSVHSLRMTRTAAGLMKIFWDEVEKVSVTDTTFAATASLAFEVDPLADTNGSAIVDDVNFSPVVDGTGAVSAAQSIYESEVLDLTANVTALGIFEAGYVAPTGTDVSFYTATSTDGVTFEAYVAVAPGGAIASTVHRYIKFKIVFTVPQDSGTLGVVITPFVTDVTINWFTGTGSQKYPSSVSYVFRDTGVLLDMNEEYSDVLGGDSAILNDITVQAKPLYLGGANTDVQWQGTTQTPPVPISASNPLSVSNGQVLTYKIVLSNGMDISRMSGANPAAAAITAAGGASAAWVFTRIHPTQPILQITITGNGTLTNLQLQGKGFANSNAIAAQTALDTTSVVKNGARPLPIANQYILTSAVALLIANRLLLNYKDAISYVPSVRVQPLFSCQINDRITVIESNSGVDADYVICGVTHVVQVAQETAEAETELTLLKVV